MDLYTKIPGSEGSERADAAQESEESVQHNRQHTHGAEPSEICPECAGAKLVYAFGGSSTCHGCNGTGKLHHT